MKTVRDHIASQKAIPAPPPGATHALIWEPYGPSRAQWALVWLDASPDDDAALLDGPPDMDSADLTGGASSLLGRPVALSARIECEGEYAYYVTPAAGGW